jgi:hypothetical protein
MAEIRVKGTGTIKLFENDNTSSVTIASPASLGGDRTITLPDASVTLASGTMLATDGSGANLTALDAGNISAGTLAVARGGTGLTSTPSFRAQLNSAQTIATDTTTKMAMANEIWDTTSTYDTSLYRWTPAVVGKYLITVQLMFTSYASDATAVYSYIYKNGSVIQDTAQWSPKSGNHDQYVTLSAAVNLTSTSDYLEAFGRQGSGGDKDSYHGYYTFWEGHLLIGA